MTAQETLSPEELFDRINTFIEESRAMIREGAMMDVEGLDRKVKELCDMVLTLSQQERLQYADKLQTLLGDMGQLGEEMSQLRDRMGDEIRSLSKAKKAAVAYNVADSRDGYGKKKEQQD